MNTTTENIIVTLTLQFAKNVVVYCGQLDALNKFSISNQLIRSGTSIGANVWESQSAESKKDFVHKLKIALKEAEETHYWLLICDDIKGIPSTKELIIELTSILKIINKIISTTKSTMVN